MENNQIIELLKEQNKFLKLLALEKYKKKLSILDTLEKKKAFELSDGLCSSREISKKLEKQKIKISHMTITTYWKEWASSGIVEESEKFKGRYKKLF